MRKHDKENVERLLASVRLEIAEAKINLGEYAESGDPYFKEMANERLRLAEIDLIIAEGCL